MYRSIFFIFHTILVIAFSLFYVSGFLIILGFSTITCSLLRFIFVEGLVIGYCADYLIDCFACILNWHINYPFDTESFGNSTSIINIVMG